MPRHKSPTAVSSDTREGRVRLDSDEQILEARRLGARLAEQAGFSLTDRTLITAAIAELSRNALQFAGDGEIAVALVEDHARQGLTITAVDRGPGIPSLDDAMADGFSSCGSLGLGLPGVKRVMDDFEITSGPGRGTTVVVRKWKR
jgi:serine/threonine-protein kinase RsbT